MRLIGKSTGTGTTKRNSWYDHDILELMDLTLSGEPGQAKEQMWAWRRKTILGRCEVCPKVTRRESLKGPCGWNSEDGVEESVLWKVAGEDGVARPHRLVSHMKFYLSSWAEWKVTEGFELKIERWTKRRFVFWKDQSEGFFLNRKICYQILRAVLITHMGKNWTSPLSVSQGSDLSINGDPYPASLNRYRLQSS